MHFTSFIPALLSLSPLAFASPLIEKRGTPDMTCGNIGAGANKGLSCGGTTPGACCSQNGWCGDTVDHCGTGCQPQFGSCTGAATGGNGGTTGGGTTTPPPATGGSTANRPQVGNVLYGGGGIYDCTVPGTVAMTFDDGPYLYTDGFLDYLAGQGVVVTFFVTGNNLDKGAIDDPSKDWARIIKKMDAGGHQVASHTWTHPDLSTLSEDGVRGEMTRNEQAFLTIIGKYPTYMRPPYSSCTGACPGIMASMGYHVCYFDLDTDDYNQLDTIQVSKNNVDNAIAKKSGDYLSIAHDIHQVTAQNLAPYMVQQFKAAGYKFVTIGDCLGDPKANWYRSS